MPTRQITLVNKLGLHARAAAKLVSTAGRYVADIKLRKDNRTVNAKSIMGVMMLAAGKGSTLDVLAEGKDADAALDAIEQLVNNRFDEAE